MRRKRVESAWASAVLALAAAALLPGHAESRCDSEYLMSALADGDAEKALEDLRPCPPTGEFQRLRGLAHHVLFHPDSVRHYLESARKAGLGDDTLLVALAEAQIWNRKEKEAATLLKRVKNQQAPGYLMAMAGMQETRKRLPKALAFYDRALGAEKSRRRFEIQYRKARLLSWMSRLDSAIALYGAIAAADSAPFALRIRSRIGKAETLSWKKELDKAQAELEEAIRLDPRNVEGRLEWGKVLEWQGRFPEAKERYKDVLILEPEHKGARQKLEALLWVK